MEQADWDALKAQMDSPWGSMTLQCDQFVLTLQQHTSSKSKSWMTGVYVDGVFKGAWVMATLEGEPLHDESRRFLRKVSKSLYCRKEVEAYRKVFGKRAADKHAAAKHFYFDPSWKSFNSLKKHLLANNTNITRINEI